MVQSIQGSDFELQPVKDTDLPDYFLQPVPNPPDTSKPMNEWTDEDIFNNQLYEQTMKDRKNINRPSEEEMFKMSPNQLRKYMKPQSSNETSDQQITFSPDTSEQPQPVVDINKGALSRKEFGGGGIAPTSKNEPPKIAGAAIEFSNGKRLIGKSHFDVINEAVDRDFPIDNNMKDGFYTSTGKFITRKEAFDIAKGQNQIQRGRATYFEGTPAEGQLASEDLGKTEGLPEINYQLLRNRLYKEQGLEPLKKK